MGFGRHILKKDVDFKKIIRISVISKMKFFSHHSEHANRFLAFDTAFWNIHPRLPLPPHGI